MSASRILPNKFQILVFLGSLALVALLGAASYWIGWQISFAIFYLLPIFLCVHLVGRWAGLVLSVAASVMWVALELTSNPIPVFQRQADEGDAIRLVLASSTRPQRIEIGYLPIITYWNGLALGGFFVIFTLLLSSMEAALEREKRINQNLETLMTLAPFEAKGVAYPPEEDSGEIEQAAIQGAEKGSKEEPGPVKIPGGDEVKREQS
jgi:hypothetical protein